MKTQLFTKEEAPRSPYNKLMHVEDAGCECILLKCKHCGYSPGWEPHELTVTEYKRGVPCPRCKATHPKHTG